MTSLSRYKWVENSSPIHLEIILLREIVHIEIRISRFLSGILGITSCGTSYIKELKVNIRKQQCGS